MSRPNPMTQRYVINKTSEGVRQWMGATVVIESDGRRGVHVVLSGQGKKEFRCRGEMNRRLRRVTGLWDPKHGFDLELQSTGNGLGQLLCKIYELPGRMTSDTWSADEDGP